MSASKGEEESEELALFRQQWRQELGIAQPPPASQEPEEEVSISTLELVSRSQTLTPVRSGYARLLYSS